MEVSRPEYWRITGIAFIQNKGKSLSLFQGIFPTQGSNSGLPHCRWILYQLRHKGSPIILEWVACSLSSRFLTQELNQGLLHCRQILYQLDHQGSPIILEWVAYPFCRVFPTQELNRVLLPCRRILYQLSYQGSPERERERERLLFTTGLLNGLNQ